MEKKNNKYIAIIVVLCIIAGVAAYFITTSIVKGGARSTATSTYSSQTNYNNSSKPVEYKTVKVIDFSQMSKEEIKNWCETNNIICNITEDYSDTVEKGAFIKQSVEKESSIYEGDKITITYSLGKEPTLGEKNALKRAKSYLSHSAFSYESLIEQLEYEKYTHEEAVYAVDNCGADWNEQCAKKAKSYMSHSSFSRESLISQLEYEGFTTEQAEYGVSAVGY